MAPLLQWPPCVHAAWKAISFVNPASNWSITSSQLLSQATANNADDDWVLSKVSTPIRLRPIKALRSKTSPPISPAMHQLPTCSIKRARIRWYLKPAMRLIRICRRACEGINHNYYAVNCLCLSANTMNATIDTAVIVVFSVFIMLIGFLLPAPAGT